MHNIEDKTLLLLVATVSLAFCWILWPFSGAILWATVLAILFASVYRRVLESIPPWRNLAAVVTVLIILVIVILPLTVLTNLLVKETTDVYASIRSGQFGIGLDLQGIGKSLPGWAEGLLERMGLPDLAAVKERISAGIMRSGEFLAGQIINLGQRTVEFIISLLLMLYLLFFLLRDGPELLDRIGGAIPLRPDQQRALFHRFAVAVRAIVKGSIVVALVQGTLGGLIFAALGIRAPVLWGAIMTILSLLPVVGSGLVWLPVAIYLLATGDLWRGILLIAYGAMVIGLVDNLLRPILIGHETKIPDYVVLLSTLGGISTFGANGFVIGPVIAAMFLTVWSVFSASRLRSPADRIKG